MDDKENGEAEKKRADEADIGAASNIVNIELKKKFSLKSHMDIIRSVQFVPHADALATVSEDCMVKLWNLSDLNRKYTEASTAESAVMEPYLTLRGHTGPLLCATSITDNN